MLLLAERQQPRSALARPIDLHRHTHRYMMRKPDPDRLAAQCGRSKLVSPGGHWNPPLSGDMDLRITRDGTWHHEGRPILRESLVRLFSTILRRDEDGHYYLLTPAEKWRIQVDDVPFLAIFLESEGKGETQTLRFTTNLGDRVEAGPEHPIQVKYTVPDSEPAPYVHVRQRLWARISRSVFLELAQLGSERESDNKKILGVWSQREFFSLGSLEE